MWFIVLLCFAKEKAMEPHSSTLAHGRRSLVGWSPWGCEESDMTEWFHFHFSLSCIGEGNGNPLQCSCLENPRDSRAWWAAIYGVAQSRTRLKQLSSSSSSSMLCWIWFANTLLKIFHLYERCLFGCLFDVHVVLLLG